MHAPRKILVPTDLSKRSEAGLAYAAMLAERSGAELVVVANVNLPERAVLEEFSEAEHVTVDEAGELILQRLAAAHAPDAKATVALAHRDSPADGILDIAEAHEVDMIVVASHGRAGMTRWLLGSVAEKLARSSSVPVVIVPVRDS